MSSSTEIVAVVPPQDAAAAAAGGRDEREQQQDSRCHRFCQHPNPMRVRYVYAALFLVANVLAWVTRECRVSFYQGQRLNGCHDCLAADAVLVISFASFLFFLVMFSSTVNTSKLHECRNSWHCQWWLPKALLLGASIIISTFTPAHVIQLYGRVAPYGAGVFLFIQLLSVIRYITRFNYGWCHIDTGNRYLLVITISVVMYSGSTVGITLMSLRYTTSCLNATFIGTTALLVYLMPLISLKYEAKGFMVGPGLVGAYIVFLCYSAIKSEPETEPGAKWLSIMNFVFELMGTVAAAFSTGSDYKHIPLRSIVVSEDDVPYGYGFFHFIFATGSMYFGMLFVGWNIHRTLEKWTVDVGWTSTWVHFVNEVMAAISLVAILVARVYAIGWLRQLLANIFGIGEGEQQQEEEQQPLPPPQTTILNMLRDTISDDDDTTVPPPPPLLSRTELDDADVIVELDEQDRRRGRPPHNHNGGSSSSAKSSAAQQQQQLHDEDA